MNIKDRYYDLLDRWDKFKANPLQTHIASGFLGGLIALYLRSLV